MNSSKMQFVLAKIRIVNKKLSLKTIPLLELAAMEFGVITLIELYKQFSNAVVPVNIVNLFLFSDSTICLSWLKSKVHIFSKIEKKNVFLNN